MTSLIRLEKVANPRRYRSSSVKRWSSSGQGSLGKVTTEQSLATPYGDKFADSSTGH